MKMTWEWLLQIFKGEGEVSDVFVSQKRRRNIDCRFGFVHVRKIDEARKAIFNLNGVKIRGKCLKVSFARFDKEGRPWDVSRLKETGKGDEVKGKEEKYREVIEVGMNFKDVVEGRPN